MIELNRVIRDMPAAQYHADPCDRPSLSQSLAHTLIKKSPAHAYLEHPRLGGGLSRWTPSTDDGSIVHAILLGRVAEAVGIVEADDFKTKAAQAQRDAIRDSGRVPIVAHKFDDVSRVAEIIRKRIEELGYRLNGASEAVITWEEPSALGPVLCRARLDHVFEDEGVILDLKKITSADPATCAKHAYEYGYDLQRAAYTRALDRAMPEKRFGGPDFVFLFFELEPPFCVTPARFDGRFRALGEQRWERAVNGWARCLADNKWPAYTESSVTLEAPSWALAREMDEAS